MTNEIFAKPCVGAIIEKTIDGEKYMLIQTREKEDGQETNGMIEIPAGKIREYEDVFSALRREVWKETGLRITSIQGADDVTYNDLNKKQNCLISDLYFSNATLVKLISESVTDLSFIIFSSIIKKLTAYSYFAQTKF